jgi:hypothetical protein
MSVFWRVCESSASFAAFWRDDEACMVAVIVLRPMSERSMGIWRHTHHCSQGTSSYSIHY